MESHIHREGTSSCPIPSFGIQSLHPLASRSVRDTSDRLRIPGSWSPSCYTPVWPDCHDALSSPCLLITIWPLVKAHGVTRNEPKIHVICYITNKQSMKAESTALEKPHVIRRERERERERERGHRPWIFFQVSYSNSYMSFVRGLSSALCIRARTFYLHIVLTSVHTSLPANFPTRVVFLLPPGSEKRTYSFRRFPHLRRRFGISCFGGFFSIHL